VQDRQRIRCILQPCRPPRHRLLRSHLRRSRRARRRHLPHRHRLTRRKVRHSRRMPPIRLRRALQGHRRPRCRTRNLSAKEARQTRRQWRTRSSLPLGSEILGNGDGLRPETDARLGHVFCCLPDPDQICRNSLCTRLPSFCLLCLLVREHAFGGSNISSCNMLEITCILRTHRFFFPSAPSFLASSSLPFFVLAHRDLPYVHVL